MKITITALLALCLCTITSMAQTTYTIKGSVGDSVMKIKLHNAPISVLNPKDSILKKYTRSAADGSFTITGLPAGKYLILVTYPECADYVETISLDGANTTHSMGNINMELKSRLLNEVIIKGATLGVKINGDTTEYNAKSFKIQPNDKVEDLLRQFPGIQIDKDGKVTVQGETAKFLVDGEQFFGDDPLLVTKNIRADMVDKVQVYDKKSDQATFTGVDDGVKQKTINIKLKEDKKNGMFGKVDVGKGTDGYYEGQALFNKFKGKYKVSVYGTASNDGKNNLGYADNDRLGTTSLTTVVLDDGNSYQTSGGDALDQSSYNRVGFPSARTGGAHYDTKFNDDKSTINTNYRIGSLSLNTTQNTLSQVNLPGSSQTTNRDQDSYAHTFRQKADLTYQNIPNTNTNFKFGVDGMLKNTENRSNNFSTTRDSTGALLNRTTLNNSSTAQQKTLNATLLYNKKFAKVGRTISWNVSESYNSTHTDGYVYSDIFTPVNAKDTVTDQYKPTNVSSSVLNSNLVYTEPLTKKWTVALNYGLGLNNSLSDKESFNKSLAGKYDAFDATYSNNFKFNQLTNQGGAIFNYKYADGVVNFGTKASAVGYDQINQYTGVVFKRSFINWSPQARFQHSFSPSSRYSFSYSGNNTQPTVDQLQPIRDNSNPLSITIGNANLSPQFRHSFNTSFSSSQRITAQYFSIYGNYSFIENAIVSSINIDPATGKSVSQYVNIGNKTPTNYSLSTDYERKILGVTTELGASTNGSTMFSYSNNVLNTTTNRNYSVSLYVNKYIEKKYSIYAEIRPNYSFNTQTLLPSNNYNSAGLTVYGGGAIYLPGKFQISSSIDYTYQAAVKSAPAVYYKMWNASLIKTFFKGDNLKFSLTGNNLLNQNQNIRTVNASGFTQNTYNSIMRYFIFNITWDFSKFGTTAATTN
ncbi:MAG: TonB-dependent receptor [Mucilaginibacter sp.]